ncbi:protein HEXIM1-like [Rhopilema esculentum]|uniref:protein HEXIM1-like n=1 Tax=Rhopilema esculentum TaxID=499914 RepID=UPI0031E1333D
MLTSRNREEVRLYGKNCLLSFECDYSFAVKFFVAAYLDEKMSVNLPNEAKPPGDTEVSSSTKDDVMKTCEGAGQVALGAMAAQPAKIKKRNRRGSKKQRKPRYKWRPYHKLSWEEKRKLNERDSIRAERRREIIRRKGRPIAPYNTTQFLMDEHDTFEPDLRDLNLDHYNQSPAANLSRSDGEEMESFTSEESFYEKDFSEMYEISHAETLHAMTKEELIESYLELERKVEFLEKEVRSKRSSCSVSSDSSANLNPGHSVVKDSKNIRAQNELSEKNKLLEKENLKLKEELRTLKGSVPSEAKS